jgi:uncharacterized membrane protein YdjX (TVP38/TMEM64 family)
MNTWLIKIVGLLIVLAAGVAAAFVFDLQQYASIEAARSLVESFGAYAPIAFIILYAVFTVAFLPAAPLTVLAGLLFGALLGTLYTVIGATVGAVSAFAVTRFFGAAAVENLLASRLEQVQQYNERLATHGFKTVLLLRLIPLFPFNGLNFALGVSKVAVRDYALATVIGIVPGAFLYALVGASILTRSAANIGIAVLAVLAFGAVTYYLRDYVRRYVKGF